MMSLSVGILTAIIGGAVAQLLMKTGMSAVTLSDFESAIQSWTTFPLHTILILLGVITYILSMVAWVHALKNRKLNKAYPLLSLGYVVVYGLAAFWPGIDEPYTIRKTVGISLIVLGVWYSQRSPSSDEI